MIQNPFMPSVKYNSIIMRPSSINIQNEARSFLNVDLKGRSVNHYRSDNISQKPSCSYSFSKSPRFPTFNEDQTNNKRNRVREFTHLNHECDMINLNLQKLNKEDEELELGTPSSRDLRNIFAGGETHNLGRTSSQARNLAELILNK